MKREDFGTPVEAFEEEDFLYDRQKNHSLKLDHQYYIYILHSLLFSTLFVFISVGNMTKVTHWLEKR